MSPGRPDPDAREPSRRAVLAGAGGLVASALLAACTPLPGASRSGSPTAAPSTAPSTTPPGAPSPTPTPPVTPSPAPSPPPPPRPPLEVMVGQMLMLGFPGTVLDAANPVLAEIADRHLGSVLLFGANVTSPEQLAALTAGLQDAAGGGLLVAVDQEGGRVARLGPAQGFPPTRSAADLGALGDPGATRAASTEIAQTLRAAGIGLNLAPVVDVNTNTANPVIGAMGRSFSADPVAVAEHAAAFVRGHHDAGVLTTLKHFPGHGSSRGDTHAGFVDVTDTWDPAELEPYRALARAGLVDAVMVAHVFNAVLDPTYPASLSALTVNGVLRGEVGHHGVVVSDDLLMGAIAQEWGFEEAVRRAVLAGTDILSFATLAEGRGRRAHETILAMVDAGEVSEARIALSFERVMALKARA